VLLQRALGRDEINIESAFNPNNAACLSEAYVEFGVVCSLTDIGHPFQEHQKERL
jgi:hypothetical protein